MQTADKPQTNLQGSWRERDTLYTEEQQEE